jgi:hypothetical protein
MSSDERQECVQCWSGELRVESTEDARVVASGRSASGFALALCMVEVVA